MRFSALASILMPGRGMKWIGIGEDEEA